MLSVVMWYKEIHSYDIYAFVNKFSSKQKQCQRWPALNANFIDAHRNLGAESSSSLRLSKYLVRASSVASHNINRNKLLALLESVIH